MDRAGLTGVPRQEGRASAGWTPAWTSTGANCHLLSPATVQRSRGPVPLHGDHGGLSSLLRNARSCIRATSQPCGSNLLSVGKNSVHTRVSTSGKRGRGGRCCPDTQAPCPLSLTPQNPTKSHKKQKMFSMIIFIKADVGYLVTTCFSPVAQALGKRDMPRGGLSQGRAWRKDGGGKDIPDIPGGRARSQLSRQGPGLSLHPTPLFPALCLCVSVPAYLCLSVGHALPLRDRTSMGGRRQALLAGPSTPK